MLVRRSWACVLTVALLSCTGCGHRAYRIVTATTDTRPDRTRPAIASPQVTGRAPGDMRTDPIGRLRAVRAAFTALTTTTVAPAPDYHTFGDWPTWRAIGRCEQPGAGPDGIAWAHHGSYNGGLGILNSSWRAFRAGEPERAYDATPAEQIAVARRIRRRYALTGWACALGARMNTTSR